MQPCTMLSLTLFALIATPFATQSHADATPECVYESPDQIGNGWGFENGVSCLITVNTLPLPTNTHGPCIDDNADGWGWNGVESCQVTVTQSSCVDSDPKGDGWGWDGVTSCRVVPVIDKFDESETLKSHFGTHADLNYYLTKATSVQCPTHFLFSGGGPIKFNLFSDGQANTDAGQNGSWSTGMATSDGRIKLTFRSAAGLIGINMNIEGANPTIHEDTAQCAWITSS